MFLLIQCLDENVLFDSRPYGTLYHTAPHSKRTGRAIRAIAESFKLYAVHETMRALGTN